MRVSARVHYVGAMPGKKRSPRSAVVTGAARGIGREIAIELVRRGYAVVVTDIDGEAAVHTAEQIGADEGLAYDVTDEQSYRDVAARARTHAPLGIWINNAGVGFDGTVADQESGQIRELVEVNFLGVVWGTRAAVEAFRAQAADGVRGGEIGITASLSAHGPVPGLSVYAATKAAVLSLATSLSVELRKEKIRVHAICPDGVRTPMLDSMTKGGQGRALVASGKTYEPAEVARTFVAMFGTRRVYRTMPVWRGALVRLTGLAPGPLMRLEPVMRKIGERKLRKEA